MYLCKDKYIMMKKIKINFVDFWNGFDKEDNFIINTLRLKYEVTITTACDYLFYSVFGYENAKYDCVKIYFTGENIVPDFNLCDYALGFHYIEFGERYMRFPLFLTYDIETLPLQRHIDAEKALHRPFCSFVVSNGIADSPRERFFKLLSEYKPVDSGGRYLNNVGAPVADKLDFISRYKFNIAFENSRTDGYTTEKLLEPLQAGTLPVYWGNPLVTRDFCKDAFLNANDYSSLEALVEAVVALDNDDERYIRMLTSPWLQNPDWYHWRERLLAFLSAIIEKPLSEARCIPARRRGSYRDVIESTVCWWLPIYRWTKRIDRLRHFRKS